MNTFCSALSIEHPPYFESRPQGISGDIEGVGNRLVGEPGISKHLSLCNVDLCGEVLCSMDGAGKDNKVFNSVVGFNAVDMVDLLTSNKAASNMSLHDCPVFFDWLPGIADDDVSSSVQMLPTTLPNVLAGLAAKMPRSVRGLPVLTIEDIPACGASGLNIHIPIICELGQIAMGNEGLLKILERNGGKP